MTAFLTNPRRTPRAAARCRAAVVSAEGAFESETEDVGARGCQLVSPARLTKGTRLQMVITSDGVPEPLRVAGTVAWVSAESPWRVGIAFHEAGFAEGARWFQRLVAAFPRVAPHGRVPDRISVEATVFLGSPPRFVVDFSPDETAVLRAIARGATIEELRPRLGARWPAGQRALFSLLSRQAVTLERAHAVHPDAWEKVLAEAEAPRAIAPPPGAGAVAAAPPRPAAPAPYAATPPPAAPTATPPPAARTPTPPPAARTATPAPGLAAGAAQPDFVGAGVGWRARAPRVRSQEAEATFQRAREEVQAGSIGAAIGLLRRALALAPGDPEIALALGQLAFKDRAQDPE
jgi:hypothetical protein